MSLAFVSLPFQDTGLPDVRLAQLIGIARQMGQDVSVHDFNVRWRRRLRKTEKKFWLPDSRVCWLEKVLARRFWEDLKGEFQADVDGLLDGNPSRVFFWITASSLQLSLLLAAEIKKRARRPKIIFLNPHLFLGAFMDEDHRAISDFLQTEPVDGILQGPLYNDFARILTQREELLGSASGFHCVKDGMVHLGKKPTVEKGFDSLPFSDYSLFPLHLYDDKDGFPMQVSDGCACDACRRAGFGPDAILASGMRIFSEAAYHRRMLPGRHQMKIVRPAGEKVFPSLQKFAELLSADMEAVGKKYLEWEFLTREPEKMTSEQLGWMIGAGCKRIGVVHRTGRGLPPCPPEPPRGRRIIAELHHYLVEEDDGTRDSVPADMGPSGGYKKIIRHVVEQDGLDAHYLRNLSRMDYELKSGRPGGDGELPQEISSCARGPEGREEGLSRSALAMASFLNARKILFDRRHPFDAFEFFRSLSPELRGGRLMRLFYRHLATDARRMMSMADRLQAAEQIFNLLPQESRRKAWMGSPTFHQEGDHSTYCRHRMGMKVFKDYMPQRGERLLIAALARATQIRMLRAAVVLDEDRNEFLIRWGESILPASRVRLLCRDFLSLGLGVAAERASAGPSPAGVPA
ncbi:MAG TPA: hypothetical protein P5079_00590 [Elusimicrobiota bacterium]|nr:hypothetical protein [Elusimicrobiota bacterium]